MQKNNGRENGNKLNVSNLSKRFGEKIALDSVGFEVEKGEFLSILGPSGCGKTTLLRILIGLLEPDSGSVCQEGRDISLLPPAERNMGIVFQNYALFENMTVLGNVEYVLKQKKEYRSCAKTMALDMLNQVGLAGYENKKPGNLSGGQQQRVAIARTLVLRPDIMLFDEPMSALDIATRLSLRAEIKRIQEQYGITMIYITHDQEEAFAMSDRIMVMGNAVIHQLDTPNNIMENPADSYVTEFVIDNLQAKVDSLCKYIKVGA